jgi:exonuclease SbcC
MYKLTLKNFKCFSDTSVSISSGLNLFDGPSGIGKSSLIQAFVFAITGEGKKLYKQGCKSLSVILEYSGDKDCFKIVRKKGPESLTFEAESNLYEDDEAQTRINRFFGKNFLQTSIIKQKGESSFLSFSSKDKMSFLQSLLFSETDVEEKKKKIKKKQQECKDSITNLQGQKQVYQKLLSNLKHPDFNNEVIELEYDIDMCKIQISEMMSYVKDTNASVLEKNQKLQELNSQKDMIFKKQNELSQKADKFNKLKEECEKIELERQAFCEQIGKDKLEEIDEKIQLMKEHIKLVNLEKKVDNTIKIVKEKCEKDLNDVKCKLSDLSDICSEEVYSDAVDKLDLLRKRKRTLTNIEENKTDENIEEISQKIEECKKFLESAQLYKTSLKCPHCNHFVRMNNSLLEKVDLNNSDKNYDDTSITQRKRKLKQLQEQFNEVDKMKKLLEHYQQELKKIDEKLDVINENSEELKDCTVEKLSKIISESDEKRTIQKELKRKKVQLSKELDEIENKTHHTILQDVQEIKKIQTKLKSVENIHNINNITHLENEYTNLVVRQKELVVLQDKIDELSSKKRVLLRELKSINTDDNLEDLEIVKKSFDEKLEVIKEEIETTTKELKKLYCINLQECQDKIDIWNKRVSYLEFINEQKKIQLEYKDIEERLQKDEKLLIRLMIISSGLEYAEGKVLSKFIDTINHNLGVHLDAFFTDPMSVVIKSFNENDKPVINMEIFYKGIEIDVANLSGGEYDRLNLALTMTFNEISKSSVLILDESLASINQELATEIIMHLKENYTDKLVWMTQHQAVKGMFDNVFDVQKL